MKSNRFTLLDCPEITDVLEARLEKVKATRAPKATVREGNAMEATLPPVRLGKVLRHVERLEEDLLKAGQVEGLEVAKVVHYWLTHTDDD